MMSPKALFLVATHLLIIATTGNAQTSVAANPDRAVLGWEERVLILPEDILLEAKFTPGTEGNILHVQKMKTFKRKGKSWVRFTVANRKGGSQVIERRVSGRRSFRKTSGSVRRPVVKLGICIAQRYAELDVALGDRSSYHHEIIIGRESLAGNYVIDPASSHIAAPNCSLQETTQKSSKGEVK